MQRISTGSLKRILQADGDERRAMANAVLAQVQQDVRKGQWALMQRRKVPLTRTRGRESFMVTVGDDSISKTLFIYGECDFDNVVTAHRLLGRPDGSRILMDVGANIGSISIPAVARGVAESAIAIEPEMMNFSLLAINVHLNRLDDRFTLLRAAAGDGADQELRLVLNSENLGDHRVQTEEASAEDGGSVAIDSVTMDHVGSSLDPATDLIWMDIQGYEGHALKGATALIARRVPMVMEFWPDALGSHGTSAAELLALLAPYQSYFDLSEPEPVARDLAELDGLYDDLAAVRRGQYYVDILLV